MPEESEQTTVFTLHYDGKQITNHKMKLDDFLFSLEGFSSLLKEIAQEMGIPQECLRLEIQPLEQGGVKAYVVAGVFGLASFIAGHLGEHFFDDIHLYERSILPRLAHHVNQFLDRKKSVSDYKDLQQLTLGLDVESSHIMTNKQVHAAAEQFASALEYSVDTLEVTSTIDPHSVQLIKSDFPKFHNPFAEIDPEEKVYNEEKVLRIEGLRFSGNEWIFYEKDSKGNWDKENTFRAIVLDQVLLSLGRDNSLNVLQEKNLYCTVRCREITKAGNKKRTIERSIIRCRLKPESLF